MICKTILLQNVKHII